MNIKSILSVALLSLVLVASAAKAGNYTNSDVSDIRTKYNDSAAVSSLFKDDRTRLNNMQATNLDDTASSKRVTIKDSSIQSKTSQLYSEVMKSMTSPVKSKRFYDGRYELANQDILEHEACSVVGFNSGDRTTNIKCGLQKNPDGTWLYWEYRGWCDIVCFD